MLCNEAKIIKYDSCHVMLQLVTEIESSRRVKNCNARESMDRLRGTERHEI